jgi:ribosomal-protein-alanine N-acetyltransferase
MEIASASPHAPHWPQAHYLSALDPAATPRRIALAAERGGRLAGFAIVSLIPPQAELESIAVAPEARRQGVGRGLLRALQSELKQQKVMELLLEVRASNHAALALYAGLGFTQVAVRSRYYADPVEDAVLMNAPVG